MFIDLSSEPITETDKKQFCVDMMKRLDIQRRNEQFCDVILDVGSGDDQARLKAHRIVLCAASPFFFNVLNSDMKEKKEGVIRLEETSKAVMEEVLEYLYTGHVDINEHNAFDLLHMADFLIVPSLKELSSKFISQALSPSDCIKTYYFAERYQCPELQKSARDFAFANFIDVTQSDDFLDLSVTQVEEWISSDDIIVKEEEEIFQVIVKWMERDENRKHESFFKLFGHVRLVYVSRSYIFNVILPHPLVKNSATCTAHVLDVMKGLSYGSEECYFAQPPRSCLKTYEDAIIACGMKNKKTLCYIPSENNWYKMTDLSETLTWRPPRGVYMSTCHSKLYATGVNVTFDCTVERYDPLVDSWAAVKSFAGEKLYSHTAVVSFQGFLYVIGGRGNTGVHTDCVHRYNPDTNLWQEVAPISFARYGVCAVADKNSLYVIGGGVKGTPLDVVERLDTETNCWETIASILEKRMCACGAVVRGRVFLFGGITGTQRMGLTDANVAEMYDPSTDTWSKIDSMGAPQIISSAVSFKGKVYVIACSSSEQSWPDNNYALHVYDVDKNEWENYPSISTDHNVYTVASLRIPRDVLDKCELVEQE
ncbi:kelch-like protein 21 [Oculina patagonica]